MSDTYTDVVEERGEYRAVITIDTSPDKPENDFGCPVLRVESSGYGGGLVTSTGYGSHSAKQDGIPAGGIDALQHFVSSHGWSDGIDIFGRYLAIFHGGSIKRRSGQQWDDPTYVAYVTERMVRDAWGFTGPVPAAELDEWAAYCEGEVYFVTVQRRLIRRTEFVTFDDRHPVEAFETEEWWDEPDSTVGGYYGEQWAREAALEALDEYAPRTCILPPGSNPDDCTTHEHESVTA